MLNQKSLFGLLDWLWTSIHDHLKLYNNGEVKLTPFETTDNLLKVNHSMKFEATLYKLTSLFLFFFFFFFQIHHQA